MALQSIFVTYINLESQPSGLNSLTWQLQQTSLEVSLFTIVLFKSP